MIITNTIPVQWSMDSNFAYEYVGIAKKLLSQFNTPGTLNGARRDVLLPDGTRIIMRKTNGNMLKCFIQTNEPDNACLMAIQGLCIALQSEYDSKFHPENIWDQPQYIYLQYNNQKGKFEEVNYRYPDSKGLPYITDIDYATSEEQQPGVPNVVNISPCDITRLTISTVKEYWIDEGAIPQQNFYNKDHHSNYVLDDEVYFIWEMSPCQGCDVACVDDDNECEIRIRTHNHYYVDAYKMFADDVNIFKGTGLSQITMKPWFYLPAGTTGLTVLAIKREHSGDAPFILYKSYMEKYPISGINGVYGYTPVQNDTVIELAQHTFDESLLSNYVAEDTSSNLTTSWMKEPGTKGFIVITAQHYHNDVSSGIVKYRAPYLFSVSVYLPESEIESLAFNVTPSLPFGGINYLAVGLEGRSNESEGEDKYEYGNCEYNFYRVSAYFLQDNPDCILYCTGEYTCELVPPPTGYNEDNVPPEYYTETDISSITTAGWDELNCTRTLNSTFTGSGIDKIFNMLVIPDIEMEPVIVTRYIEMGGVNITTKADSFTEQFYTNITKENIAGFTLSTEIESFDQTTSTANCPVSISASNKLSIGNLITITDSFTLTQSTNASYDSYVDYFNQIPWDVLDPQELITTDRKNDMDSLLNATGTRILYVDAKNGILLVEKSTYTKHTTFDRRYQTEFQRFVIDPINEITNTRNNTVSHTLKSELILYPDLNKSTSFKIIRTRNYSNYDSQSSVYGDTNVAMSPIHGQVVIATADAPQGDTQQSTQEDWTDTCVHRTFHEASNSTDHNTETSDDNVYPSLPYTFTLNFDGFGWPFRSIEPLFDAWSPGRLGNALDHMFKSVYTRKIHVSADTQTVYNPDGSTTKNMNFIMLLTTQAETGYDSEDIIIFNGEEIPSTGDASKGIPSFDEIHSTFVT